MKPFTNIKFRPVYFIAFIVTLALEVLIALYVTQPFVRGFVGDYLVVFLVYFFIKSFFKMKPLTAALGVLVFSFMVEFLQLIKIIEILNLEDNKFASTIIGTTFSYHDLIAYTLGVITILFVELKFLKNEIS